jgi:hypothetical protein
MRLAWCLLMIGALVSCGSGSSGGGNPISSEPCTTGTELVLFDPVAGSLVSYKTRKIVVASNLVILRQARLAARSTHSEGGASPPAYPLVGPVPPPTPTPTPTPIPTSPSATPTPTSSPGPTPFPTPPFTNPIYYQAQGFHLKPGMTYLVEVAIPSLGCPNKPIRGARFSTRHRIR